jgi:hypothetical protein
MSSRKWFAAFALAWLAAAAPLDGQTGAPHRDSCVTCHAQFDDRLGEPAKKFADDIHSARGLTCAACHGGDPATDDYQQSMSRAKGYRGVPGRAEIPALCSKCHSDAAYMRAFNPSLRTDQQAQYRTSVHGKRLAAGDAKAAVCSDCHTAHGIRPASSPLSSVNPQQIVATCARCHADAEYMKSYRIPTDQVAGYKKSAHFEVLSGGDVAAPTCVTCHGNHGATPPGVASVENVCGTCHLFQQQLFDQSPHKAPWQKQNLAACLTCHGNHEIRRTGDAMLGAGPDSACVKCHAEGDGGWKSAAASHSALTALDSRLNDARGILDRAEQVGMDVSDGRIALGSAREQLIKARVDVHAMSAERVLAATSAGDKQAGQARAAGQQALSEHAFRRKGLALSLVVIALVVIFLWLYVKEIERGQSSEQNSAGSALH